MVALTFFIWSQVFLISLLWSLYKLISQILWISSLNNIYPQTQQTITLMICCYHCCLLIPFYQLSWNIQIVVMILIICVERQLDCRWQHWISNRLKPWAEWKFVDGFFEGKVSGLWCFLLLNILLWFLWRQQSLGGSMKQTPTIKYWVRIIVLWRQWDHPVEDAG